jgi:hypothetical protein
VMACSLIEKNWPQVYPCSGTRMRSAKTLASWHRLVARNIHDHARLAFKIAKLRHERKEPFHQIIDCGSALEASMIHV